MPTRAAKVAGPMRHAPQSRGGADTAPGCGCGLVLTTSHPHPPAESQKEPSPGGDAEDDDAGVPSAEVPGPPILARAARNSS